jgi:tetratricopeptide (TPR) repeat protein
MTASLRAMVVSMMLLSVVPAWAGSEEWSLSYSFEAKGNYAKAIQALSPVIEDAPEHEFARLRIAWLKYLNRDYNASVRDYQRALEINKQSLDAMLGVTLPLLAQGRWREAEKAAEAVIAIAPSNYYAHLRLLVATEGQAMWDALADRAHALAARYPSDATAFVYLARAEARRGNAEAAIDAYRAVLERAPAHTEAAAYIAGSGL